MISNEIKFEGNDGTEVHVYEWLPDNPGKITGIVQLIHGIAEHSGRYAGFAEFLTISHFNLYK